MALDEIESARVHLSFPEAGIFERDRRPAKASITVATKLGGPVNDNVVRGIQQLVASAVPDLSASNVAVLDARGELLSSAPSETESATLTPEQQKRQTFERGFAGRIEEAVRASGLGMPIAVKVTALGDFRSVENAETSPKTAEMIGADAEIAPPDKRDFPLSVQIALAAEPGPVVRDKLLGTVREAIGYDVSLGDTVSIATDPTLAGTAPPLPRSTSSQPSPDRSKTQTIGPQFPLWLLGLGGLLVIAMIGLWFVRRSANRSLSVDERQAFADRLRSLLDQELLNGRSPG